MIVEPFGLLKFDETAKEWVGYVDNISPGNKVELSISVVHIGQSLTQKIGLIKQMAADYEVIVAELYDLIYKKFRGTEYEVTRDAVGEMYYLSAVNLKEDNRTWWLVLEPCFSVDSIYNHFFRFTIQDGKIIWANFETE